MYHHKPLDDDILHAYDWVVLDAQNPYVSEIHERFYLKNRAKLLAYVSVGEIEKFRSYARELKRFAIGENPMWDTLVADVRSEEYRLFLLENVIGKAVERGFDGFFLDTLDAYKRSAKKEEYEEFEKALVELIKEIKRRYPDKLLVLNRGFEIINEVRGLVDGVVAESLFFGLDEERNYREVSEEEREHLIRELERVKALGIPVIVVDYAHPRDERKARTAVRKILSLGFIPYVGDRDLSSVGYSACELVPRKVILLYDSTITPKRQDADVHRVLQMPLEYIGFVPVIVDVNEPLPEVSRRAGYAGVVAMYISKRSKNLDNWLVRAKEEGLRFFFLEDFPFYDEKTAERFFNLKIIHKKEKNFRIVKALSGHGFEAPLSVEMSHFIVQPGKAEPVVVAKTKSGLIHVPFAFTDWGGYAVSGTLLKGSELWVYDPFWVLERALKTESFPIPDTTTENGMRILTAHIDGDAFPAPAEFDPDRLSAEVIRDEILKRYKIPHTVSVIEGEVAPYGVYPKLSKRLEAIARSIFALPHVQPASHSFSHPFTWQPEHTPPEELKYGYNLPIPGYSLNWEREISGSLSYVDKLTKDMKKGAEAFLWTGYCDPNREQIRMTYLARVPNVNGGNTTISETSPFLTKVSPMGVNYGSYFQVYAPVQNENVYTNLWSNPFWGYINVLQTFRLTEEPRRLKPVSIYYHFYSGQKLASLNALKKVYETVLSWETNPMFITEFALKVFDFRATAILKEKNGYRIKNSGYIRTLRVEKTPDIRRSEGAVGYRKRRNYFYVHLDGSGNNLLVFSNGREDFFNLVSSNAQVKYYEREGNTVRIVLESYVPARVSFSPGRCEVYVNGKRARGNHHRGGKRIEIKAICPE